MKPFELTDLKEIAQWADKWDCEMPVAFPDLGFIEPGVAAGFLVKAECGVCFLEGFINNPDADKEVKKNAEKEIIKNLLNKAEKLGFRKILALTTAPYLSYIAKTNFGFRESNALVLQRGI